MITALKQAECNVEAARSKYFALKKDANKLRYQFLRQRVSEIAAQSSTSTDNIYDQLLQRETQRDTAWKIKYMLGKTKKIITAIE